MRSGVTQSRVFSAAIARSARLEQTAGTSPLDGIVTDFLAIHVRNATLPEQQGVDFTHPLARQSDGWYFMHNGYMPNVCYMLGMDRSEFDSAEYFSYIVPEGTEELTQECVINKLHAVPAGGATSGNAIAVHPGGAYVVHWSPPDTPTPRFFTLHQFSARDVEVVASERIPALAPLSDWQEMAPCFVRAFPFGDGRSLS